MGPVRPQLTMIRCKIAFAKQPFVVAMAKRLAFKLAATLSCWLTFNSWSLFLHSSACYVERVYNEAVFPTDIPRRRNIPQGKE